jgi:asparagine synthase (glutamine-hydrolysing)
MARQHVTVVLSGDGGDEAFSGYGFRYAPHAVESAARSFLPGAAGRGLASWLGMRWPRPQGMPRSLRWGTLLENIARDPAAAYFSDLCLVKPHVARRILGWAPLRDPSTSAVYDLVTAPYLRCGSSSAVQRAQYADLQVYLPNDVLVKVDRMTMQHSIEVRCPLLDHRVIELAFRIPVSRKMPQLRAKHLLRRIARRRLPAELARLPKRGFHAPVGEWIAGSCARMFEDDVLQPGAEVANVIDTMHVRRLFEAHRTGQEQNGQALWTVWMLARWLCHEKSRASATSCVSRTAVGAIA